MGSVYKPRLTEEQFDNYWGSYHSLIKARRAGQISQNDYERQKETLNTRLNYHLGPNDVHLFSGIDELLVFLSDVMSDREAVISAEHEFEHGKKAEELGYNVQYGAWLMKGYSGNLVIVPFTHVMQESSANDLDQIKFAPRHMSVSDRQ